VRFELFRCLRNYFLERCNIYSAQILTIALLRFIKFFIYPLTHNLYLHALQSIQTLHQVKRLLMLAVLCRNFHAPTCALCSLSLVLSPRSQPHGTAGGSPMPGIQCRALVNSNRRKPRCIRHVRLSAQCCFGPNTVRRFWREHLETHAHKVEEEWCERSWFWAW
jgi:hypothetical protein